MEINPFLSRIQNRHEQNIEAIRDKKTGKIISDTRNLGAISPKDQEWSTIDWTERALRKGIRK